VGTAAVRAELGGAASSSSGAAALTGRGPPAWALGGFGATLVGLALAGFLATVGGVAGFLTGAVSRRPPIRAGRVLGRLPMTPVSPALALRPF